MAYPANSIMEVKVGYVVANQQCFNVLHYRVEGATTGFDVVDLVDSFLDLNDAPGNGTFSKEFADVFGQNVTVNQVTAQIIWPTRYVLRKTALNLAGTVAVDCEALNLQASFEKHGDQGNRHNVGGIRIGGVPSSFYNESLLTAGAKTAYETLATNMLKAELSDGLSTATYVPVILNKEKTVIDGKTTYPIIGHTDILYWTLMDQIRTQRSRTVGRGI